jgi:hypothetical protein
LKHGQLAGVQNQSWRTKPSVSCQYYAVTYNKGSQTCTQILLTAARINLSTPLWLLLAADFDHCLHFNVCIHVQLVMLDARKAVAQNFKAM